MAWDFKREESNGFSTNIPEGKHRIRIKDAQKAVSKSGNDMLVLQFEVSGYKGILYHYITFMKDKPEITNKNLTQFFDAFKDIPEGDLNIANWIGKVGACGVKHEEYNGNVNAKVGYFIPASKQGDLPMWKDANGNPDGFVPASVQEVEDLPF